MEYTLKYHTTTAANMSTDWIGPRLYQAKLEEVLRGALLAEHPPTSTTSSGFRYPTAAASSPTCGAFMDEVGPAPRSRSWPASTPAEGAPLPERVDGRATRPSCPRSRFPTLSRRSQGAPADVLEAAARLACTEAVIVNLVVDRADLIDAHWTYFYDRDVFFTRLSTPHLQSPNNVPPGCGSLQAECYFSRKYRPLDRKPGRLHRAGDRRPPAVRHPAGRRPDPVPERDARRVRQRHLRSGAGRGTDDRPRLSRRHGIAYCGRYGEWAYIWTDESFMSGENAAQRVIDRL